MIFVETSVLLAAFLDFHTEHQRCFSLVASLRPRSAFTSIHCLTELYSVTTRLPPRFRVSPELGIRFVQQTSTLLTVIALEPQETLSALERFASKGLGGALVYDALIVDCARKKKISAVYTLNKRNFDAVAPDLAEIIREP